MLLLATHRTVLGTVLGGTSPHLLPLLFFTLSLALLQSSVATDEESAWDWEPDDYPNFAKQPKLCTGPERNPPSAICDPDGLLDRVQAKELDELIAGEGNNTACLCPPCPPNRRGLIIKVALLRSFRQRSNQTLDETLKHFAERTRSRWNFSPVCQHDVLVFVSETFNKVYISMGTKAERVIGYSEAKEIVKDTSNHFKYGNVKQGLESIIASLQYRQELYDPRLDRLGLKHGLLISVVAALASLLVIVIAVWFCIRRETQRQKKAKGARGGDAKTALALDQVVYEPVKSGGGNAA